jgi:hypothetical protein
MRSHLTIPIPLTIPILLATIAACGGGKPDSASGRIDSVIPADTALAQFRAGLAEPTGFSSAAPSLDDLIARFVAALERADTAALVGLVMNRAEFAYLYYPTVPEARPPYDLSAGLLWFMIDGESRKGLGGLLDARAGAPLAVVDSYCEGEPRQYGPNRVWAPCFLRRVQSPGDTVTERLFGPIVARDGAFKFVSLANKL